MSPKGPRKADREIHKTIESVSADQLLRLQFATQSHKVLVAIAGPHLGERFDVKRSLTIGRHPNCDIVLNDSKVSSQHARLEDRGDSWTLIDLSSTNGVFVNGTRTQESALKPQDRVMLGETVLRFEARDSLEQEYDAVLE